MKTPKAWIAIAGLCLFGGGVQLAASGLGIKIPDGTPVRLSLMDSLSSATNHVDDPIHFEVWEDVKVGDIVVLPKGSTAQGHIVEAEPKRRMGRAGKLNFSVDYAKAPDGTNVRLRASSERKGKDKTGTVIVGSVLLSPLFLIMRGKDIELAKGTEFNAYVDGEREVSVLGSGPVAAPGQSGAMPNALPPAALMDNAAPLESISVKSTPDGADITVDGKYVGSTPSTVRLAPGDHTVVIEKSGFKAWHRTMALSAGGNVNIDATLEKNQQ